MECAYYSSAGMGGQFVDRAGGSWGSWKNGKFYPTPGTLCAYRAINFERGILDDLQEIRALLAHCCTGCD
jgi:hypothetical protein